MDVVGTEKIVEFIRRHGDARGQLQTWLAEVQEASWKNFNDITAHYPSASYVPKNYVIFNIKGNRYRLEIKVNFNYGVVTIIRIGTHAEYDQWKP